MKAAKPIEFKGTTLSMTVLATTLRSTDPAAIEAALAALCGPTPDFFNDDPAVLDLAELAPDARPDWPTLIALLRRYRVNPIAVRNAAGELAEAARASGLIRVEDVETQIRSAPRRNEPAPAPAAAPQPAPAAAPAPPTPTAATTVVVDRPLRSGQQVYARGGDLVVLAMVNAGAEVIADGNIHVYAPLRGRALAGARGDAGARILTTCFGAELTSVAGVYRTFEPGLPKDLAGRPVQVRLVDTDGKQQLIVEALNIG